MTAEDRVRLGRLAEGGDLAAAGELVAHCRAGDLSGHTGLGLLEKAVRLVRTTKGAAKEPCRGWPAVD